MSEFDDIEAARAAYKQVRQFYDSLAQEVRHILETRLAEAGLKPASVTHRPKEIDSFAEKITRKHYTRPLEEMTDLAGVRVVCPYESDLSKVAETIESNFDVHERVDKARDLGVDRMGYNGKAFVVKLGDRYAEDDTSASPICFAKFRCGQSCRTPGRLSITSSSTKTNRQRPRGSVAT